MASCQPCRAMLRAKNRGILDSIQQVVAKRACFATMGGGGLANIILFFRMFLALPHWSLVVA